jgi:hypothetical protein
MIQDQRKDSIGRSHYNTKRSQERMVGKFLVIEILPVDVE